MIHTAITNKSSQQIYRYYLFIVIIHHITCMYSNNNNSKERYKRIGYYCYYDNERPSNVLRIIYTTTELLTKLITLSNK